MTWKLIKSISDSYSTKRDGVCLIDSKAITKDSQALLIAEFKAGGGGKAQNWKIACATQSCQSKAEKWIADNNSDSNNSNNSNNTSNNTTGSTYQFGDERAVTGLAVKQALQTVREEFRKEIQRLNNRIESLETWQKQLKQKSDSKSNPERTPVGADEDGNFVVPERCLGVTKAGKECQQTKNRLQANGYCGQHQDQSGEQQDQPEENTQPELITSGADLLM